MEKSSPPGHLELELNAAPCRDLDGYGRRQDMHLLVWDMIKQKLSIQHLQHPAQL
jgi:hypothetical protein